MNDLRVILSFDVEEHDRIEAAAGLEVPASWREEYAERVDPSTRWLLDELARHQLHATFFVLGTVARRHPDLIRAMHQGGHEVASHGTGHQRLHVLTPDSFREDVRQSKEILEQIVGGPVVGYRAPTFSLVRQTAWGVEVLSELGMRYDSSIYPVVHDRYGVSDAPRWPFRVRGRERTLLEIPPATWRLLGLNVPVGGGGYFRLLPLWAMERAFAQTRRQGSPAVAMLYFHPWEFDPEQRRLPMPKFSNRFRTYHGIDNSRSRLSVLLKRHRFCRALDVVQELEGMADTLPLFDLARPISA